MSKSKVLTWAVVACAMVAFATAADAKSIKQLTAAGGAVNSASDDSWEYIIQRDNNNTLDVGDSLAGIFNLNFYGEDGKQEAIGPGTENNQWSGVFQTIVVDKKYLYTSSSGDFYAFSFAPDPGSAWAASAPGAMVLMYEDSTKTFTFDNGPLVSTDWDNATDGDFFWALGFAGTWTGGTNDNNPENDLSDLDEGWIAEPILDTVPVALGNLFGSAQFALNRVYGFAGGPGTGEGWDLGTRPHFLGGTYQETEFKGIVQVKTPVSTGAAWPIEDDLTRLAFTVNRIVPVPAAAWMGLALLGALGIGRRLRRR